MTCFFVNCVFENNILSLFSQIYDVIKTIMITCFLLITYLKMTYFYYFCGFVILWNNYDNIFFVNCVFENDIFMYVLLYHLY